MKIQRNSIIVFLIILAALVSAAAEAITFTTSLPLEPAELVVPFGNTVSVNLPGGFLDLPVLPDNEYYGNVSYEYHWSVSGGPSGDGLTAEIRSSASGGAGVISSPGCHTLTFSGKATYSICRMEEDVEHSDGPHEVTLTASEGGRLSLPFWLVTTDRIEITGNGASGTVSDRTSNLLRGTKYTFKACRTPANSPCWPAGQPVWSSSGIGISADGDECVGTFYSEGDGKTLTASCGSYSKTAAFNSVTPQIQRVEFHWDTQGIGIFDKEDKWQAGIGGLPSVNDPACYIQGQKGKARLKFHASKNLTFPVTVSLRGDVHWLDEYITGEDYGRDTMTFGTDWNNTCIIESEANAESKVKDDYDVDISWRYKVRSPNGSDEWIDTGDTDDLRYYLVWAQPSCEASILQDETIAQSCEYAEGKNDIDSINEAIMDGIEDDYIWIGNCHFLSSNFVRMLLVQGIDAILHRWSKNANLINAGYYYIVEPNVINSMVAQKTISIKPIGSLTNSIQIWNFHQWAESGGKQYDPSTNFVYYGSWGNYEDYLYAQYQRYYAADTINWDDNHSGQNYGCEALGIHTVGAVLNWNGILTNWLSR